MAMIVTMLLLPRQVHTLLEHDQQEFLPIAAVIVVDVCFEAEDGKYRNRSVNRREAVDTPHDEGVHFTIVSAKRGSSMG